MALLEIEELSISFTGRKGTLTPVRDVSFTLEAGETLGVVGESGCGKSLTNLAIMGLLPPTAKVQAKKLNFCGHDLLKIKEKTWRDIRGSSMSMVFQNPMTALNPCLKIGYQIIEGLIVHGERDKKRAKKRALELLEKVGIPSPESRFNSYPHQLSGGMCQRVMLAQALALKPKLLIADEPTTALDVTIQAQILSLMKELQQTEKMATILVGHDLAVVAHMGRRLQVMYAGEIVETGLTETILQSPKHPYTAGLLACLPKDIRSKAPQGANTKPQLYTIEGMVPDLKRRPEGCQFYPRCERAQKDCQSPPPFTNGLRCFHPLD